MYNNRKGFTLAELLIVVAIIAVLVAISIPVFAKQTEKAREAVDIHSMRNAKTQMALMIMEDPNFKEISDPSGAVSYSGDSGWYAYNFKSNKLTPYTSSMGGDGYKGLISTAVKGNTDFKALGINVIGDLDDGSASSKYMLIGYKDGQYYIRLDSQTAEGPANTGSQTAAPGNKGPKTDTPGTAGPKPGQPGQPTPPPKKP